MTITTATRSATLTVEQVAGLLDCSGWKVRKMVKDGEIPHFHIGSLIRFRPEVLETWLANLESRSLSA